jgi:hypothetical protein
MNTVALHTVSGNDSATILKQWELEDTYYERMINGTAGEVNRKARRYPYIGSPEGKTGLFSMKTKVPIQGPIKIVYLDGKSDCGLPHTRGKTGIALPVFLLWDPSEKTLDHELVHLSQKQFSDRWWSWYKIYWKFRPAKDDEFLSIPIKWRSRRRMNPDTLGTPYTIWSDRYIPLSIFSSETDPDLRNCKRGFWDLKMSQWTWEEPSGWIKTFGTGFNDEHPNEIAAHWLDGSAGKEKQSFFDLNPV